MDVEDDLALAHLLADAADGITGAAFVAGGSVEHRLKRDGTPVSEIDQAVEERLLALLREHRPDDAVLGEEVGGHGDARRRWLLDGIDGTVNFVAGSPLWGTGIALLEGDRPLLGVNTSPGLGERMWAAAGRGAWRAALPLPSPDAAVRMRVADRPSDGRLCANIEIAWATHPSRPLVDRLVAGMRQVPMTAHPGLMVAAGELDLAVALGGGPWDFAPIMAILWEAGGCSLDLYGRDVEVPAPPMIYASAGAADVVRRLLASGSGEARA